MLRAPGRALDRDTFQFLEGLPPSAWAYVTNASAMYTQRASNALRSPTSASVGVRGSRWRFSASHTAGMEWVTGMRRSLGITYQATAVQSTHRQQSLHVPHFMSHFHPPVDQERAFCPLSA